MSDSKLRELERRWRETRSVQDEAAYLRERVRVGDLTQERLELAAYCGHEGARVATQSTAQLNAALDWYRGLDRWGQPATACAAVLAASFVFPTFQLGVSEQNRSEMVRKFTRRIQCALSALQGQDGDWQVEAQRASKLFRFRFAVPSELGLRAAAGALLAAAMVGDHQGHAMAAIDYACQLADWHEDGPHLLKGPGRAPLSSAVRAGVASWALTGQLPESVIATFAPRF